MQKKSEIRHVISDMKKNMDINQIDSLSDIITDKLIQSKEYEESENILIYVSYNQEVKTDKIINKSIENGKKVYVPKVFHKFMDDKDVKYMEFVRITSLDELVPGFKGIPEPVSDEYTELNSGLIVMPGIAFDNSRNRIGYGGGFYDRYLMKHMSDFFKVAVCFDYQVVEDIPSEEFDIRPDIIITDRRIIQ